MTAMHPALLDQLMQASAAEFAASYPMDSADFARAAALMASDNGFGLPHYAATVAIGLKAAYRTRCSWTYTVQLTPLCGQRWEVAALEGDSPAELLSQFATKVRALRAARLRDYRGYRRVYRTDARLRAGFWKKPQPLRVPAGRICCKLSELPARALATIETTYTANANQF